MADEPRSFGELMKKRREQAGYTQKALAEKLGLPASFLSFVETGRKNPSKRMMDGLEKILGPIDDLRQAAAVARAGETFGGAVEERFAREDRIRELADQVLQALGEARSAWDRGRSRQVAEAEWHLEAFQRLRAADLISRRRHEQIAQHLQSFVNRRKDWSYNPAIPSNAFDLFWKEANDPASDLGRLEKFARVLEQAGKNADQLIAGRGAQPSTRPSGPSPMVIVPVILQENAAQMGTPFLRPKPHFIAYEIAVPARGGWADAAFGMEVDDDAMAPDYPHGSVVLFGPVPQKESSGTLLVVTGDQARFRQAIAAGRGSWRLRPTNPAFAEAVINRRDIRWVARPVGALTFAR